MIRRRELITLLGGAAAWPLAARAQQGNADDRVSQRRIVLGICTDGGRLRKGLGETGLLIVVLALVKPLSPPSDLSGQLICGPIEA
jgi:hypothetical protein